MAKKFDVSGAKAFFSISSSNETKQESVAKPLIREVQEVQEVQQETDKPLVHHAQEVQHVQEVQEVQQVQDVQEVQGRNTQGRKGKKLPRAHVSLTPEAYEYLSTMAGATRKTMSEYIENLLIEDKEKNPSYPQIRELMRAMKGK